MIDLANLALDHIQTWPSPGRQIGALALLLLIIAAAVAFMSVPIVSALQLLQVPRAVRLDQRRGWLTFEVAWALAGVYLADGWWQVLFIALLVIGAVRLENLVSRQRKAKQAVTP